MTDAVTFVVAVIFVSINGLTMLAWAAAQGYKMKPTAFAFIIGAIGNLLTGSVTPISGQSSILTVSHFMKRMNERVAALLLAVIVMVPLGLFGGVTRIAEFAGNPVLWGMMAGVGFMIAGISFDMIKQEKRIGIVSLVSALITHAAFVYIPATPNPHALVYVIAASVTLPTLDFVFLQKDPKTGKRGRRVNIATMATDAGYEGDMSQNESPKFWTKEYWEDFKMVKPKFTLYAILFALAFISLNIGTNIAFGNITAGFTGGTHTQNMDHLTVINSLADIPSVLFGGAPVGAIISATAASPAPVIAGVVMMALCALLLLLGLMTKAVKYVPVQAIAGFLFIIGFFSTFVVNFRNVFFLGPPPHMNLNPNVTPLASVEAAAALAITALTKNPFLGLVAGISMRYIGVFLFPFIQ